MNDGSQDWNVEASPSNGDSNNRRRTLVIVVLVIGIIIVAILGFFVVSQTWDLWFGDSTVVISDVDKTATSACESFIAEFPGTPCPQ